MSQAISAISDNFILGKSSNFRIICSVTNDVKQKSYELVSDIIIEVGPELKVTIEEPEIILDSESKRGSPVLILMNSRESFEKLKEKFVFNNMRFRKFYLLILVDGLFDDIEKVIKILWGLWIHQINVVYEDASGSINMYTFFPYSDKMCGNKTSLRLINQFNLETRLWMTKEFFPEKFKNLNSCSLKVACQSGSIPSVMVKRTIKGGKEFYGVEIDIFREIAEDFNASSDFEEFNSVGTIFANGSIMTTGILPSVHKRKHDAGLGTLSLQLDRVQFLSDTKCFLSVPTVIVIPPAKKISPIQKLARPFSFFVWLLLVSVFLAGFLVILTLKLTSSCAYNFIVGSGVNYPSLNMMIAFFGGTQNKLPNKNFARYILMKFLIFCLIIRCLYQGKLFIVLRVELHEKEMATIDDMFERDMIFYTYESMMKRIQGFKFANRSKAINISELGLYRDMTLDSSFHGVVFSYLTQVLYMNYLNQKNFTYLVAREYFVTNQLVFYFQKNHFLSDKFSEKIDILREAGIIGKLSSKYVDQRFLKRVKPKKPASSLTFEQLSPVFGLLMAGLVLSMLAYIFEVLWKSWSKNKKYMSWRKRWKKRRLSTPS